MNKLKKLRELFKRDGVIQVMGAHNAMGAKLAEKAGFDCVWASGLEISTSCGVPDANILTMTDFLNAASSMNEAVSIPIVADCDTGFGNSSNVIHMVRKYEAAGIAGVCIEDKLFPKVNSFVSGRQELALIAEFVGKILAAKNSQNSKDFMVIARVEALIAGWGQEEALKRANAYAEAGADAILIHSKAKDVGEIKEFIGRWERKTPLIVIPTTYPKVKTDELKSMGVKMVIYANQGIRSAIKAMEETFTEIKKKGGLGTVDDRIAPLRDVFELQGMSQMKDSEKLYLKKSGETVKSIIPAAGDPSYEKSMREIVKDYPIAMIDINGKSILQRNVDTFNKLNISDITVITGYNANKFDVEGVSYIENKNFAKTTEMDSIMMALENATGKHLIAFSDVIFEKEIVEKLAGLNTDIALVIDSSLPKKDSSVDLVVAEKAPDKGARKINIGKKNRILKIGKNLDPKEAKFEFTGLSYFSPKGIGVLKDTYYEAQKVLKEKIAPRQHFLQVLQRVIDKGFVVTGIEVSNGWLEVRNFENYKIACSIFTGV